MCFLGNGDVGGDCVVFGGYDLIVWVDGEIVGVGIGIGVVWYLDVEIFVAGDC